MTNQKLSYDQKMTFIQCYCWFYKYFSNKQKRIFIQLVDKFTHKMNFVGVGIDITEEIKIVVAGWAVLLVLNRPLNIHWYMGIKSISIYSGNTLRPGTLLGQVVSSSSSYCKIHLPWNHIRDSSSKSTNDENTILHEFAHVLDHTDRTFDGQPSVLLAKSEANAWSKVFNRDAINAQSKKKKKSIGIFLI